MRYALRLEAIGENMWNVKFQSGNSFVKGFIEREMRYIREGMKQVRPWVARIVAITGAGGYEREFIRGEKDYTEANSNGSRGVFIYYFLEPGIYEINERRSWREVRRYFAEVIDDKTMKEIHWTEVRDRLPYSKFQ